MSDPYCPPPDPSDYLEGGIDYPTPEGKEWKKSTDLTHNDINYDDPKVGKGDLVARMNLDTIRAKKLKERIHAQFSTVSKSRTPIRFQQNVTRKVVNEI